MKAGMSFTPAKLMADRFFVVELTGGPPGDPAYVQPVWADQVTEHDEYLYFFKEDGTVGGLFLKSIVKNWREATDDESSKWTGGVAAPS
jgi:hypothetical protein